MYSEIFFLPVTLHKHPPHTRCRYKCSSPVLQAVTTPGFGYHCQVQGCVACGSDSTKFRSKESVAAYDYVQFTGQQPHDGAPTPLTVIPAHERLEAAAFRQRIEECRSSGREFVLLDVRPKVQFQVMSLPGAVNVPYDQFGHRFDEVLALCSAQNSGSNDNMVCRDEIGSSTGLGNGSRDLEGQTDAGAATANKSETVPAAAGADVAGHTGSGANFAASECNGAGKPTQAGESRSILVLCRRGNHSQLAVQQLRQAGFTHAIDLIGGLNSWASAVDEAMPYLG